MPRAWLIEDMNINKDVIPAKTLIAGVGSICPLVNGVIIRKENPHDIVITKITIKIPKYNIGMRLAFFPFTLKEESVFWNSIFNKANKLFIE